MSRLFQQIVNYPMPKPRSIEKDVKVFPWSRLDEALTKVLQKYVSRCFIPLVLRELRIWSSQFMYN
jgi:hypothetical protein